MAHPLKRKGHFNTKLTYPKKKKMATGNTSGTTWERLEILAKSNKTFANVLEDMTTTLVEMRMTINNITGY